MKIWKERHVLSLEYILTIWNLDGSSEPQELPYLRAWYVAQVFVAAKEWIIEITYGAVERAIAEDDLTLFVYMVALSWQRDRASRCPSATCPASCIEQTVLIAIAQQPHNHNYKII